MNNTIKVDVRNLHKIGTMKTGKLMLSKNEFGDEKRVKKFLKTVDKYFSGMSEDYVEHNIIFPVSLYANYVWKDDYGRPIAPDIGDEFVCDGDREIIAEVTADDAQAYIESLLDVRRVLLLVLEQISGADNTIDPNAFIDEFSVFYCVYNVAYKKLIDIERLGLPEKRDGI